MSKNVTSESISPHFPLKLRKEDWRKVREVLDRVLDMAPKERSAFLKQADLTDLQKSELDKLLLQEANADRFLSGSADVFSNSLLSESDRSVESDPNLNRRIGKYRILEELGVGGMGVVYLGERDDGSFDHQVAIKLLKREFNAKKIRDRFQQETEIQARLKHPNIASLIDAGTTEDGIPFLIMEYIEGHRIDEYCRKNALDLNERLILFNKVCDAVSHAHRNLIVHRDLKPSNIIVTESGEPKLLDFGIAKTLDEESSSKETTIRALTPQYASPEQILGDDITTSTDVYSLGLILFELLTGRLPFKEKTRSTLSTAEDKLVVLSRTTREDGSTLFESHELRGDLDNILRKALQKEPGERYSTVESLSKDLRNYLNGLPVEARPNTYGYVLKKFYQRNRLAVFAGAFTLLSLFAGISIALWQASVAREQARIAQVESEKSKQEEEKAKAITTIFEKIVSYANPGGYAEGSKKAGQEKVIDALNAIGKDLESDFPNRKDIHAELNHKFAEVYVMLARQTDWKDESVNEKAKFHALRALELRKEAHGDEHELVAKDLYYLAASPATEEKEGIKMLAKGIGMMRKANPKNPNYPHMLFDFASGLHLKGSKDDSNEYYRAWKDKQEKKRLELAETLYLESAEIFSEIDSKDAFSTRATHCRVALVRAERKSLRDNDEYLESCKGSLNLSFSEPQQKSIREMNKQINQMKAK